MILLVNAHVSTHAFSCTFIYRLLQFLASCDDAGMHSLWVAEKPHHCHCVGLFQSGCGDEGPHTPLTVKKKNKTVVN